MTIEEIANILATAARPEDPLAEGQRRRKAMADAIRNGGDNPYPYRAQWLMDTVKVLFATLATQAEEFNTQYPHDSISATDLFDALASAMNTLIIKTGGQGIEVNGTAIKVLK